MCKGSGAGSCLLVGGLVRWLSGRSRVSEGGKREEVRAGKCRAVWSHGGLELLP